MNTVELFCGTKSFSKVVENKGHNILTIDNDAQFKPDICEDVMNLDVEDFDKGIDILWASPPCTTFSVASISKHWTGGWRAYEPKTEEAKKAIELIFYTLELVREINPKWWHPRPMCKNGDKCHESAPRGSKTGTQGLKGKKERGVIPSELFVEILEQMKII